MVAFFCNNFFCSMSNKIVLALPIAIYAMNKWLSNFAYHTNLAWWIFAMAAIISFTLVAITIAYQSYKAAVKDPVISLRYE